MYKFSLTILVAFLLAGCVFDQPNYYNPQQDEKLTVGKVQKEIKIGMSSAEVAQTLGSPNIVTTDEQRREVWVYDKTATQVGYSSQEGGVWLLLFVNGASGATASKNQRTLTVIVKFDQNGKVRDLAYHSSSF